MEGVAFGTEVILENMRAGGYQPDSLTLAGTTGAPATPTPTCNYLS